VNESQTRKLLPGKAEAEEHKRGTCSYGPCGCPYPPTAHEGRTLAQTIHPNPPSGSAPDDKSSTAAKICAHAQNLFPPPFGRGRPLLYRHGQLLAPVLPWTTASPGDGGQLGGGNGSGLNTGQGGPAQLPCWACLQLLALRESLPTGHSPAISLVCSPSSSGRVVCQPLRISHLNLTAA